MAEDCEANEKISLTFLNGTGFIFNVNDYIYLRRKHRIMGSLVGTNNIKCLTAYNLGLPVGLTHLETRVLFEQDIVRLVSKKFSLLREPTLDELDQEQLKREERAKKHINTYHKIKLRNAENCLETIIASKRQKLLKAGIPMTG